MKQVLTILTVIYSVLFIMYVGHVMTGLSSVQHNIEIVIGK